VTLHAVRPACYHCELPQSACWRQHPSDGFRLLRSGIIPRSRADTIPMVPPTPPQAVRPTSPEAKVLYIEYTCAPEQHCPGYLLPATSVTSRRNPRWILHVFADNVLSNPGNTPCFHHQSSAGQRPVFVTDVAVTLTGKRPSRTEDQQYQSETKALLNIRRATSFTCGTLQHQPGSPESAIPASVVTLLP